MLSVSWRKVNRTVPLEEMGELKAKPRFVRLEGGVIDKSLALTCLDSEPTTLYISHIHA